MANTSHLRTIHYLATGRILKLRLQSQRRLQQRIPTWLSAAKRYCMLPGYLQLVDIKEIRNDCKSQMPFNLKKSSMPRHKRTSIMKWSPRSSGISATSCEDVSRVMVVCTPLPVEAHRLESGQYLLLRRKASCLVIAARFTILHFTRLQESFPRVHPTLPLLRLIVRSNYGPSILPLNTKKAFR